MTFRPQYQRNTPGGRAVDTGPPRTTTGMTGLGAVGGPRGVGAGALRVIVEFLTEYDSQELKKLEAELQRLQGVEEKNASKIAQLRKQEANSQVALTRVQNLQHRAQTNFTRAQLREIKEIRDLERSRVHGAKAQADAAKELLAQQTGFRKAEISQLVNADKISQKAQQQRVLFASKIRNEEQKILDVQNQQAQVQQRVGILQGIRANVLPKLGSLALGAVGGVFGGAIVGVGFAAAQTLISAVGEAFRTIIDPAHKARESVKGFADEITKIVQSEHVSYLQATRQVLRELGPIARGLNADILAQAAAVQQVVTQLEKYIELLEIEKQSENLRRQALEKTLQVRTAQELAEGRIGIGTAREAINAARQGLDVNDTRLSADAQRLLAQAVKDVDSAATSAAGAGARLAAQQQMMAGSAAIAAIAQNQLADALNRISSMRIEGLQNQLRAAGEAGPSARTQGLQAQIAGMQESQARAAYGQQLANIQQERALILLEKRIRFQGEVVRLESLSAEGQIIAINARIEALQNQAQLEQERLKALNDEIRALQRADREQDKRDKAELKVYDDRIAALRKVGDEQDRLNRLLDLQYRMSQSINRQQGESIGDFLSRRANEQRKLLAEQASLRRTDAISAIQQERDKIAAIQETAKERREAAIEAKQLEAEQLQAVIERNEKARQAEIKALQQRQQQLQLEVRLQKLAEQEKQLAAAESNRRQMQLLQEQLRASQEADRKALQSRQDAINRQIKAEEEKNRRIQYWINQENITRLQHAVAGAKDMADLQLIAGELAGAKRVLGELQALVRAGVLPAYMVNDRIAALVAIIRAAEGKTSTFRQRSYEYAAGGFSNTPMPLQHGGVFLLNNGMHNPFGANIRTGEGGQELGVVLSNRVARILKETTHQPPNQTFIINRSDDAYRDKQRFSKAVRSAISESLG